MQLISEQGLRQVRFPLASAIRPPSGAELPRELGNLARAKALLAAKTFSASNEDLFLPDLRQRPPF